MKLRLVLLIIILADLTTFAQIDTGIKKTDSLKKAVQLNKKNEYVKLRDIYLKVAKRGYVSSYLYKKLGDSYYKTAEYKEAVKWYRKLFDLGKKIDQEYYNKYEQCLKAVGENDKNDKYLKQYMKPVDDKSRTKEIEKKTGILYDNNIPLVADSYSIDSLSINTEYSDVTPVIYKKKLIFASAGYQPVGYKSKRQNGQAYFDLYQATINAPNDVTGVYPLSGNLNTENQELAATFTPDGKTMYFSKNSLKEVKGKTNLSKLKIFRAEKINGEWKTVEELSFNSKNYTYTHPALSPDAKRLYFSSDMPGSFGDLDIWYVEIYDDNSYSYPQNLGPKINTTEREIFPYISDENKLYFSSDGHSGYGGLDIFVTNIDNNGIVGNILNLGKPINSSKDDFSITINTKYKYGYFASNRNNDKMRDNLYVFYKSNRIKKEDAEKLLTKVQDTATVIIPKEELIVKGKDLGKILDLKPIYFKYGRFKIVPQSAVELEKVIAVLRKYPDVKLEIRSHTDSRSSAAFNLKLSEKRAKATRAYIISSGIDSSRITAKGYGETQLINRCKDGVKCTKKEHLQNRRSEFIIIQDKKN